MISLLTPFRRFVRAVWQRLYAPEFRGHLCLVIVILALGTAFYSQVEGWSIVDSLYFSVITLATVGYGDLSPTTSVSKMFTVIYVFVGIGILLGFVEKIARNVLKGG